MANSRFIRNIGSRKIQDGEATNSYIAEKDLIAGQITLFNGVAGFPVTTVLQGEQVTVEMRGVFPVKAAVGEWSLGEKCYLAPDSDTVTKTPGDNGVLVGFAFEHTIISDNNIELAMKLAEL